MTLFNVSLRIFQIISVKYSLKPCDIMFFMTGIPTGEIPD